MPPPFKRDILLRATEIHALVSPNPPNITMIRLELEDGRPFTLYGVPYEIVVAINKLREQRERDEPPEIGDRESLFELLLHFPDAIKSLGDRLRQVIVNELDYNTGLYTAEAVFDLGGIEMRLRMIPSHAIFLAMLFDKPVFVKKSLVDEQEAMEERMREEERDEFEEGEEEEF